MSRLIDADLLGLTDMEIIMCDGNYKEALKMLIDKIEHAPTIEPQTEPEDWEWCHDCKEYDHELHCCHRWNKVIRETVEELKQAQPDWIPVAERLPEKRDWYLGIFKEPDTGWINPIPFICDYVGKETKATTKECWILKECTDREEHIDYYFNLECVAWMPLPEPYAERREQ